MRIRFGSKGLFILVLVGALSTILTQKSLLQTMNTLIETSGLKVRPRKLNC